MQANVYTLLFELAWDDLKRIILQRIEQCYATVFGEYTICSYLWILRLLVYCF